MKRKPQFTPEQRAASAERLRAMWQDPEWRAKRLAAVKDAAARGTYSRCNAENNKRAWADPVKRKKRMASLMAHSEKRREAFRALKTDPAFEEKRARKVREYQKANPLHLKAKALLVARKRRGFDVPPHLWKEYRFLVKRKCLSAHEAGVALGLVRP